MDKFYADTVRLLLQVVPVAFATDRFAMKGGTAMGAWGQACKFSKMVGVDRL